MKSKIKFIDDKFASKTSLWGFITIIISSVISFIPYNKNRDTIIFYLSDLGSKELSSLHYIFNIGLIIGMLFMVPSVINIAKIIKEKGIIPQYIFSMLFILSIICTAIIPVHISKVIHTSIALTIPIWGFLMGSNLFFNINDNENIKLLNIKKIFFFFFIISFISLVIIFTSTNMFSAIFSRNFFENLKGIIFKIFEIKSLKQTISIVEWVTMICVSLGIIFTNRIIYKNSL